jgi:iron-sulfur cluster assembly protein
MKLDLTEAAQSRFKEQLEQRGKGIGIIVGVKKTGCSGYAYTLEFADSPINAFHQHFDNYTIFVKEDAEQYLDGITIDYINKGLNQKFEFINPNENGRCGCGESFTI